jgi:hypothetical protein
MRDHLFPFSLLSLAVSALLCCEANAQRNLVDVPSSEIVERGKLFFQEQAVLTKEEINTSTIFTCGIGHNFEVGVTVYQLVFQRSRGVVIDPDTPETNPDFLINMQKGFEISDWLTLGVGTRSGISAATSHQKITFVSHDFLNTGVSINDDQHKIIAGIYYANDAYAGEGTNWGAMAGVDVTLIKEKLNFVGDMQTGNTSLSVFNTGIQFSLPKEWKLMLGAQFPFPGSENSEAGVIQISRN